MTSDACLELEPLMTSAIRHVFWTMLSMELELYTGELELWLATEPTVASAIGLAGPSQGAVCLRFSQHFACKSASAMVGVPAEELGETEVNDVVGELTNMVAGDLKSKLGKAGAVWQLTVPTVVRGQGLQIATFDRKHSWHCQRVYSHSTHFVELVVAFKEQLLINT